MRHLDMEASAIRQQNLYFVSLFYLHNFIHNFWMQTPIIKWKVAMKRRVKSHLMHCLQILLCFSIHWNITIEFKKKYFSRAKHSTYNHSLNKIINFSLIDSTQLTGLCRVYAATLHNEVASPWFRSVCLV